MTFAWPLFLLFLVVPAAWAAWELARAPETEKSFHPRILRAEAGVRSLDLSGLPSPASGARARLRPRLWLAVGLAFAIVALARPQWGRIDESYFDQSREIIVALDLSRSMLTPDVRPTRLDRAKLLVEALLDRLAGERVGLVVFSGTAFLQSPLSADYEILHEFLPALGPDFLPEGGTNYGSLIDTAAEAFSGARSADRFLIVLSDGGATDDDWRSHLSRLTDKGIRVIGLGVGTAKGAFMPDGSGGFIKDESGAVVLSKLEGDTLRELAEKTGGAYRDASEWVDLASLLRATVEAGRKGRFLEKSGIRYAERFQWALAPALLCLLMSLWREFPVRPKPRDIRAVSREDRTSTHRKVSVAAGSLTIVLCAALSAAFAAVSNADRASQPGVLLGRIVGRLSSKGEFNALDCAELARETVHWGRAIQSGGNGQRVPPGPVYDGIDAVDAGSAMDKSAADWESLRKELKELLKTPEEQKQKQEPKQQQQKQDRQKSRPENQQQPNQKQEVGGSSERRPQDSAQADPSLAAPLEKLDEVRNQDSPVELFRMIENNEPRPPPTTGKNW